MLCIMSAHVTVKPSGREFFVEGSETMLNAALRAGLTPNYGCGTGICGSCKARVVAGEVRATAPADYRFSEADKAQNHVLMCVSTAFSSELVLELLEACTPEDIPEQRIVAKVRGVEALSDEVMRLHLQTPRSNRLRFLAGQRVTLGVVVGSDADIHAEYSLASCPCDGRNLAFHIARTDRRVDDAVRAAAGQRSQIDGLPTGVAITQGEDMQRVVWRDFRRSVFNGGIKAGDDISVRGPWGRFVLEPDSVRPLVFIAIDEGFAPVNSLIEHAIAVNAAESISLYWASTKVGGHYLPNQCRAWAHALDEFSYETLAAEALPALLAANAALPVSDVYLAGAAERVQPLAAQLLTAGMPPGQLHVEAL